MVVDGAWSAVAVAPAVLASLLAAAVWPAAVKAYLAQERSWWRRLRATGAMTDTESAAALAR